MMASPEEIHNVSGVAVKVQLEGLKQSVDATTLKQLSCLSLKLFLYMISLAESSSISSVVLKSFQPLHPNSLSYTAECRRRFQGSSIPLCSSGTVVGDEVELLPATDHEEMLPFCSNLPSLKMLSETSLDTSSIEKCLLEILL